MAKRELFKRLTALEAVKSRSPYQMTPGQDAAFAALETYGPDEVVTWERFCADFPEISADDKELPYEGAWMMKTDHPDLWNDLDGTTQATLERPPWTASQLESKVIYDDQAPDPRTD